MTDLLNTVEVSIVIPCLNEEKTIGICINKAKKALETHQINGEVIVADNGSSDLSKEISSKLGAKVVNVAEKGYGAALMGGVAVARGLYIIMGDADDSYDFSQIYPFIEKLQKGYDLVMGCRFPKGGGKIMPGAMPWKHRWIGNPVLTGIGRLFFKSTLSDFHCGLRGFKRSSYEKMDLRTTGMEFASEMIIKATLLKMKMTEVPITLYKDGRERPPHLRSWRDGWRHLRFMLLFSPRWLFLIPGFIFIIVGALFSVVLMMENIQVGSVKLGVNTLLVSAMSILVGFQLIVFAVFTKAFTISEGLSGDPRENIRFLKYLNLEKGIIVGILFCLIGFSFLAGGLMYWKNYNFGPFPPQKSLRIMIPGIIFVTLGVQIIFSSFFVNILSLCIKK